MKLVKSSAAALVGILTATAVYAHHSFAMFDRDTQVVKSGTVQRWAFNNPHSWLYVNVKNPDGSTTLWSFEGSAPTGLITRGITGDTFKPGETVQFMFCPLKDGRPGGAIGWAKGKDGKYLNPADGGCNGGEANQKKWEEWLAKGYTSSKDAEAATGSSVPK
ncbi:MAG TPA: DUF6152 family protein [Gammaproteobacteria bacterium]|nr:DUF6152 family protein [Gammaproteobacteria bacterium]